VINETFLKLLGYNDPQQAVGKTLNPQSSKIPIVGVIQDFQTKSTHDIIPPLAFTCQQQGHTRFHIALPLNGDKAETWSKSIAGMGKAFKEIYPEEDFKYSFVDEDIAKFYKKERDISRLLNWSAGLAVFISCLGLLGLVIYTTTQRIKEIGVRKVLGASVSQIITLLSKDFLQLVMLAFIIAAPLAWWAMNKWLEDFAYRTTISWWIFAACGVSMMIIALLTLGVQTIRSATANPVKSLRTE
jgi:ABC-type antimicrobial peptide transport system permease subunit